MRILPAITVALFACSSEEPNTRDPDAGTANDAGADALTFSCWPDITPIPHGTAVLGTGYNSFIEMPEKLRIEYGVQDGYNLVANVKMTGFALGNPTDILDPSNPFTRIRAYFDDTNIPLNQYSVCANRYSYKESPGGGYDLTYGMPVIFETCWRSDKLIGARVRVELELMDNEGHYASDTKVVTLDAPSGEYPMESDTPPCPQEDPPS